MTYARLVGTILAVTIATPAAATHPAVKGCFDKMQNWEQKECMRQLDRDARAELDGVYRAALERARRIQSGGDDQAAAIEASQKAFEAYRDAECWGFVGGGGKGWGTGTATMVAGCAAEKAYQRIEELKVPFYQRWAGAFRKKPAPDSVRKCDSRKKPELTSSG